jgi:hypothetical protein
VPGGIAVIVQIGLLFGQRAGNPLPENLVVIMTQGTVCFILAN